MEAYYNHCRILGVRPGDSADVVKRAFREKIKHCHPDRSGDEAQARALIEAYESLKGGVPIMETASGGARIYRRPGTGPAATPSPPRPSYGSREGRVSSGYSAGYRAGAELFRDAVAAAADSASIHSALKDRARTAASTATNPPGMEFFQRAESQLEQTIRRFEGQKHRSKRYWARDYISGIVKVQILYRDVVSRYPMLAALARDRLSHLERLLLELRSLAR